MVDTQEALEKYLLWEPQVYTGGPIGSICTFLFYSLLKAHPSVDSHITLLHFHISIYLLLFPYQPWSLILLSLTSSPIIILVLDL